MLLEGIRLLQVAILHLTFKGTVEKAEKKVVEIFMNQERWGGKEKFIWGILISFGYFGFHQILNALVP